MKSLVQFLNERLSEKNITESASDKEFRFIFGDLKNADETIDSIKSSAESKDIYVEKVDSGLKLKAKVDQASKWESIQDILQQYVQQRQDDDEADQNKVKSLADEVNKLNDWLDECEASEDEDKDKEDE